jgi:DNA-binding PadR family transcriptional regulator
MKQTEGEPKGLLKFTVLKFLSEKPMPGVAIVERINQETKRKWKPSPGSIYPLLLWLHLGVVEE